MLARGLFPLGLVTNPLLYFHFGAVVFNFPNAETLYA